MFSNGKIYVLSSVTTLPALSMIVMTHRIFSTFSLSALLNRLNGCFILWLVLHIVRQNMFNSLQHQIHINHGAIRDILTYARFIYRVNPICVRTVEAFF